MKLAISNLSWKNDKDKQIYDLMQKYQFTGLEIAPTRIFSDNPYEKTWKAKKWAQTICEKYGFSIPSMQSIWYGRTEMLFGSEQERKQLLAYTKKAINFASAMNCQNLVFGCLRNRNRPTGADENIAISFFSEVAEYAVDKKTVIGFEANPIIYNTNYINDTKSALSLVKQINSVGFKLNLDVGTMIYNKEPVEILKENIDMINHIHISEPGLLLIKQRDFHRELSEYLKTGKYDKYISIEMGTQENVSAVEEVMAYVKEIFG